VESKGEDKKWKYIPSSVIINIKKHLSRIVVNDQPHALIRSLGVGISILNLQSKSPRPIILWMALATLPDFAISLRVCVFKTAEFFKMIEFAGSGADGKAFDVVWKVVYYSDSGSVYGIGEWGVNLNSL